MKEANTVDLQMDFLTRLDLDATADERDVRRAYARELKRIDQERDLDGFQHLRACYERALDWVARQAAGAPSAPTPAPAPAVEAAPPASPRDLGAAVFTSFHARMPELDVLPEPASGDDAVRTGPWSEALRAALDDPRLQHLDARRVFEQCIAALLTRGWRPGHHHLLPAAVEVFGWNDSRRALERLGPAGRILDAALEQGASFQAQGIRLRTQQRDVLALLRRPDLPADERVLRRHVPALRTMASRFPDLLRLVAPGAHVAAWLERCPPIVQEHDAAAAPVSTRRPWLPAKVSWWHGFVVMLLVRVIVMLVTPQHTPPPAHERPSYGQQGTYPARTTPVFNQGSAAPTEQKLREIRKRITYRPGEHGPQSVNLLVTLDGAGNAVAFDVIVKSSDPAYAEAVKAAIIASGPFPPRTSRMFSLAFSTADQVDQVGHVDGRPKARAKPLPPMEELRLIPSKRFQLPGTEGLPPPVPAHLPDAELKVDPEAGASR